jgi:hypothetical protein
MKDRTRANKKRSRSGCSRKQVGGNVGAGYSIGGTLAPGLPLNNVANVNNIGNCQANTPGYAITSPAATGLPGFGMRGGRRGPTGRKQSGGRYGFSLEADPRGAALQQGSIPEVMKLGCVANLQNPLNPTHTGTNPTIQRGGYAPLGQAAVSEAYVAPTAGYDNKPSTWTDSVGAPVQLQIPYEARTMNPACLKTGGSRRRRRHVRKNRKVRKSRKSSRSSGRR